MSFDVIFLYFIYFDFPQTHVCMCVCMCVCVHARSCSCFGQYRAYSDNRLLLPLSLWVLLSIFWEAELNLPFHLFHIYLNIFFSYGWNIIIEWMTAASPNHYEIISRKNGEMWIIRRNVGVTTSVYLGPEQTVFGLIITEDDDVDLFNPTLHEFVNSF